MIGSMVAVASDEPSTPCKICGGASALYGVTDFNKSCEEAHRMFLPLSGVPIYYRQCVSCGLVFTTAFDAWSKADYLEHIYNDHYIDVDPDYVERRPLENSRVVARFLAPNPKTTHIDYGGGNGKLSEVLISGGINSATWDPMSATATYPTGKFGLVTAFEVFEHTPAPRETLLEILRLCDDETPLVLFSTYTIDELPPRNMDFWYLAPRNGHITVHTEASLKALFEPTDMQLHHFGNGWHLAYRTLPTWVDLALFTFAPPTGFVHRLAAAVGLHHDGRLRRQLRELSRSST